MKFNILLFIEWYIFIIYLYNYFKRLVKSPNVQTLMVWMSGHFYYITNVKVNYEHYDVEYLYNIIPTH